MTRNHLAYFERKVAPDPWINQLESWEEVTREWIGLEPVALFAQRGEFTDSSQVTGTRKFKATATYSPTIGSLTSDNRFKIRKPVAVNEDEPEHDSNYRIFHIENTVNVLEQNRVLELMVIEKT
jgi:hypothetical protein